MPIMGRRPPGKRAWISLAASLAVIVGSLLWPWIGLAVPMLAILAVVTNFYQPKVVLPQRLPTRRVAQRFRHTGLAIQAATVGLSLPGVAESIVRISVGLLDRTDRPSMDSLASPGLVLLGRLRRNPGGRRRPRVSLQAPGLVRGVSGRDVAEDSLLADLTPNRENPIFSI